MHPSASSCSHKKAIRITLPKLIPRIADALSLWMEKKNLKQCLSTRCKDARAAYVNSGKAEKFSCSHIDHCKSAISPMSVYHLSNELINNYPCDEAIKSSLNQLKEPSIGPAAFQVSKISYCVNGVATASNSVVYCHVKKVDSSFVCSSSDCGQYASKTEGSKHRKICVLFMFCYAFFILNESQASFQLSLITQLMLLCLQHAVLLPPVDVTTILSLHVHLP